MMLLSSIDPSQDEAVGHRRAWHIRVLTQWEFALHGRGTKSFVLNVKKDLIKQQ